MRGVQRLVRDLNTFYRDCPALHELDCEPAGFSWIDCDDRTTASFPICGAPRIQIDFVVVVCNFTPVVRRGYRIGVPSPGSYLERLNSDSSHYGGSNVGNEGAVLADADAVRRPDQFSLSLTLPPLAPSCSRRPAAEETGETPREPPA